MSLNSIFAHEGRVEIAAAPEGHDAFVLGGLAARGAVKTLLYICRDDGRMARTLQALAILLSRARCRVAAGLGLSAL